MVKIQLYFLDMKKFFRVSCIAPLGNWQDFQNDVLGIRRKVASFKK